MRYKVTCAATVTAYKAAIADGMDIVVKIDGDGQTTNIEIRKVMPISMTKNANTFSKKL